MLSMWGLYEMQAKYKVFMILVYATATWGMVFFLIWIFYMLSPLVLSNTQTELNNQQLEAVAEYKSAAMPIESEG